MVGGYMNDDEVIIDEQRVEHASPRPCNACGRYGCKTFNKCRHSIAFKHYQRVVIRKILQDLIDQEVVQAMLIQQECRDTPRLVENVYPPNDGKVMEWTIQHGFTIFFQMWIQPNGLFKVATRESFSRVQSRIFTRVMNLMWRQDFLEYIWDRVHNRPCQMPTV